MLIYCFIPLIKKLVKKLSETKSTILAYTLGFAFAIDVLIYHIIK